VTAPDGRRWTVRRLWLPRPRGRTSADGADAFSYADGALFDAGLAGLAIVVVTVLVLVFLPYVFFVFELLVLPLVFAYRVLLRKPWTVEARTGSERRRWRVVGWRRAGEVRDEIARALERGDSVIAPAGSQPD
jgi:hypothetical protein